MSPPLFEVEGSLTHLSPTFCDPKLKSEVTEKTTCSTYAVVHGKFSIYICYPYLLRKSPKLSPAMRPFSLIDVLIIKSVSNIGLYGKIECLCGKPIVVAMEERNIQCKEEEFFFLSLHLAGNHVQCKLK